MKSSPRRGNQTERKFALEQSVGFLLRRAYQKNMLVFQKYSPDPDLTSVQAASLLALREHSPCSFAKLGRMAAMDPATTRGVVQRMRKRHLISTTPGLEDKREVIIHLEAEGRRLVEALDDASVKIVDATLAGLNSAEKIALEFLLRKICGDENIDVRA